MSLIAKRFEKNDPPYTAAEISEEHQIPIRLTNQVLYQLQEIDLIHEVVTDQKSEDIGYQPSMDINQLNVAILLDRLDTYGSENFKIDKDEEFSDEWKVLTESREEYYKKASKVFNDSVVQNVFNRTVLKPIFDGVLRYVITMVLLLFLYNLSLNPQTSFALLVLLIMLFGLSLILVSPFQK